MATIEFIQKRIEGKEKEIAKLEKKLERIHKAEATNWEVNPYYYNENDIKWTTRDLEAAKQGLADYQKALAEAQEKAESRDVKVIIEFLERWQKRVKAHYIEALPKFLKAREKYWEEDKKYSEYWRLTGEERKAMREAHRRLGEEFKTAWGWMEQYVEYRDKLDVERLTKDLRIEADRKYDFIIERTNAIVGKITDAAGLTIGAKDDLNGFIIGDKGTAKVTTIGAGGYNIQCYHFRTLIREAK